VARIADAGGEITARLLGGGQIGEVGPMSFTGMDDQHSGPARGGKQLAQGLDAAAQRSGWKSNG
jgi:hypothetical protein